MSVKYAGKTAGILTLMLLVMFPSLALAAGGLDTGTQATTSFKSWMYTMLGVIGAGFMIWRFIQAMADKRPWMDVFVAFIICAAAGGVIVGYEYVWGLWGS